MTELLALDLLILGDVNPDIIVRAFGVRPSYGQQEQVVEDVVLTVGGSAAIVAAGAARLGLHTKLIGAIGDDALGRMTVDSLAAIGVDISDCPTIPGYATGTSVILADEAERAILTSRGAIPSLTRAHIPIGALEVARHVHVGSYFLLDRLQPEVPAIFDAVHSHNGTTSLDTNWDPTGNWAAGLDHVLSRTDVFLPNLAEAERIARRAGAESAGRELLSRGAGMVAMKLGSSGGVVMSPDTPTIHRPALSVEAVDSTGAGDSFDAAFLAGWLSGRSQEEALEMAVAAGSLATRDLGGTSAQATHHEISDARGGHS